MPNKEHLQMLKQGVDTWNSWRKDNPKIRPDLSGAKLRKANLNKVNFYGVDLEGADLFAAHLIGANLTEASLVNANLNYAILIEAKLSEATLYEAKLRYADLTDSDLIGADISFADLRHSILIRTRLECTRMIETKLSHATLRSCIVFGISAWRLIGLEEAQQSDLIITSDYGPEAKITIDNLEVAQFVYLLLNNIKINGAIDAISEKTVLILGSFKRKHMEILYSIKDELRKRGYVPIIFDFEKPASRTLSETVVTLGHFARFVIVDITDPRCVPEEIKSIVTNLTSVPIQPIIESIEKPYATFKDLRLCPSLLPLIRYNDRNDLLTALKEKIIDSAENKGTELRRIIAGE